MTGCLCDDARDQIAGQYGLDVIPLPDQFEHIHVLGVADLGDDVIRLGSAIGIVGNRQHSLDHICIGVAAFRWQYNNGLCAMRACNLDIVWVNGTAVAANDARLSLELYPFTDFIFHLYLISVGQDDDAAIGLIFVGNH